MSIDAKILNRMMSGSVEINEVYRSLEPDMLKSVVIPSFKPAAYSINEYYSKHKIPPSYPVLESLLDDSGDDASIVNYIKNNKCDSNEIGFFTDKIKERYNKYLIKNFVKSVSSDESIEDLEDVNKDIKKIILKTDKLYKKDVFSEGNICNSVEDRINDYKHTENNPDQVMGLLSGYKEIDEYTWGIKNSEMLVIGGASSSGKSLLMMCMAINAWIGENSPSESTKVSDGGKNILYVSLEMSKKQLEHRIDANVAKIRHRAVVRASLNEAEKKRWKSSLSFQKKYDKNFYILDMPRGSTMAEVEAKYETILGLFKPDAIFIDYLQLMSPSSGGTGTDWMDVGKVSEELHEFCRKKDIPVITAAQRKAAQKKSNGKSIDSVSLEDLGRSKMIGDNATIVLLIGNRQDETLIEDIEINVVKNRDGARGKLLLRKVFDQSRVEDMPDGWAEDLGDENEF